MTALLWCGAAGAWLFVVVFLLDGWTRPGYRPVRHPVSALALGPRGWVQTTNFLLCGGAVAGGALALPGVFDSILLAVASGVVGSALVASGLFPMDPMRGFPPGTPDGTPRDTSRHHRLHDAAGTVVFGSLPVAMAIAVFALHDPTWRWYSGLTLSALAAGIIIFGTAWENDSPRAGLFQKGTIIVGWSWLGALFAHAAVLA